MRVTVSQLVVAILGALLLGGLLGSHRVSPPVVTVHTELPTGLPSEQPRSDQDSATAAAASTTIAALPTPVETEEPLTTLAANDVTESTTPMPTATTPEPTGKYTGLEHSTRARPRWVPRFAEYLNPKHEKPIEPLDSRDTSLGFSAVQRGERPYADPTEMRHVIRQDVVRFRGECKGSWRLPPNQTRFCKAYDALTALGTSRLRRTDVPSRSKLLCDPVSPNSITRCHAEECRESRGCLLALPSPHCPHPSVIVPFASPSHMDGGMQASASLLLHSELTNSEAALGSYQGFPIARLQQCADVAMQSYCDHAFQLIPEKHAVCSFRGTGGGESCTNRSLMLKCVTFRYHHYPRGTLEPLPSQPLFAFLHRSEWRPSLLRDDLRLAILAGPDTTFRIRTDGYQTPRVKIGIRSSFGELAPLGLQVNMIVTLFVSECRGSNETNRTIIAQLARSWSSPLAGTAPAVDPQHAEVEFHVGNIHFATWVGCKLTLRVVGEPRDAATGSRQATIVKEVHSMLQYDSEAVRLAHELDGGEAALRRGRTSCAPHLRSDECCLNGMTAYHVAISADGAPFSRDAFAGKWQETAVFLRITPGVGGHEHPCISIVDGHMSSFDFHGVAVFPWLVVRNRCTTAEMTAYTLAADTNTVRFELRKAQGNVFVPNASTEVNLSAFTGCGVAGFVDDDFDVVTTSTARNQPYLNAQPVLLLVSLAVHEHLNVVAHQLGNIATFAPNSVVVLHVAPTWNIDISTVHQLNGTAHPHVIVNPSRYAHSKQKLAQVQLSNARYVAEHHPWIAWTHVVLFASNELFVRAGVEEHLQKYDLSFPGRPRPRQAISVLHSFFGGRPEIRFFDPEDHGRGHHYWGQQRGEGGLHGEFAFNRMMQLLGLRMYASHQLYTEGTFYNRSIAVRMSKVLDVLFDEATGDCLDSWMSVSEAFLLQLLQNSCGHRRSPPLEGPPLDPQFVPPAWNASEARQLMAELESARCGDKTGSMAWLSHVWFATTRDIYAARCSPFEGPFSFKRFERDTNNPVRTLVDSIQMNVTKATRRRERLDSGHCSRLDWHQP